MSFVVRGRRRLGDLTDFIDAGGWTNPDGTPTYDGSAYDPSDPFNPYNLPPVFIPSGGDANPMIPLQTGMSPGTQLTPPAPVTLQNYVQPGTVTNTGLPPVSIPTPVSTPAPSFTSILNSIASAFAPKTVAPLSSPLYANQTALRPATASLLPTGGISTGTLLFLGLGIGAAVLLSKKRS